MTKIAPRGPALGFPGLILTQLYSFSSSYLSRQRFNPETRAVFRLMLTKLQQHKLEKEESCLKYS